MRYGKAVKRRDKLAAGGTSGEDHNKQQMSGKLDSPQLNVEENNKLFASGSHQQQVYSASNSSANNYDNNSLNWYDQAGSHLDNKEANFAPVADQFEDQTLLRQQRETPATILSPSRLLPLDDVQTIQGRVKEFDKQQHNQIDEFNSTHQLQSHPQQQQTLQADVPIDALMSSADNNNIKSELSFDRAASDESDPTGNHAKSMSRLDELYQFQDDYFFQAGEREPTSGDKLLLGGQGDSGGNKQRVADEPTKSLLVVGEQNNSLVKLVEGDCADSKTSTTTTSCQGYSNSAANDHRLRQLSLRFSIDACKKSSEQQDKTQTAGKTPEGDNFAHCQTLQEELESADQAMAAQTESYANFGLLSESQLVAPDKIAELVERIALAHQSTCGLLRVGLADNSKRQSISALASIGGAQLSNRYQQLSGSPSSSILNGSAGSSASSVSSASSSGGDSPINTNQFIAGSPGLSPVASQSAGASSAGGYLKREQSKLCKANYRDTFEEYKVSLWQEYALLMNPSIQQVVEFAKQVPGFLALNQLDQLLLIKSGFFEIWMVAVANMFNCTDNTLTFSDGTYINKDQLELMFDKSFTSNAFNFSVSFNQLRLDETEIGLVSAIILLQPSK